MPLYGHRNSKPEPGALIDWSQPLAQGLMGFYPINEGAGGTLYDATATGPVLAASAPAWSVGAAGAAIQATAPANIFQGLLPAAGRPGWPLSIAAAFRFVGAPGANAGIAAITPNNTGAAPYYVLGLRNSSGIQLCTPNTFTSVGLTAAAGVDYLISASVQPGSQSVYSGGVPIFAGTASPLAPSYAATASFEIGGLVGGGNPPNAVIYWAGWWSRALSDAEHAAIGASPTAIFGQLYGSPRSYFLMRPAATTSTLIRRTLYDRAGSRGVA